MLATVEKIIYFSFMEFFDFLMHGIHISLVLFVLFGAFHKPWVKAHFYCIVLIWLSWLVLGAYVGTLGYCPLTQWHWQIKENMGEYNLPPSYIEYVYTYFTGKDIEDKVMSNIIAGVMLLVTIFSSFRFFRLKKAYA